MGIRLHKRLPKELVMEILEAFNEHRIGEEKTCELLGVKRTQLYKPRKKWLRSIMRNGHFGLYERKESAFHRLPGDVEEKSLVIPFTVKPLDYLP